MQELPDPAPALPSVGPREFIHKLNNLLMVVLVQAETSVASDDPAEMRRALEAIVQASRSMADSVRAYSKSSTASELISRDAQGPLGS